MKEEYYKLRAEFIEEFGAEQISAIIEWLLKKIAESRFNQ